MSQNNCVELFLLEGDGKRIGAMTREFQKEDKLKSVKLLVIS
ncbi:MAG: CopG family ribbon-helix-helix protein [Nitrososphaerales archaeon]